MTRNWNPVDSDSILFGFSLPALKVNRARERCQHDELREGNTGPLGKGNKALCTTMGSATDLANEGLRRLLVNAAYAFTGLEVPAKANVGVVGEFTPTMYGFNGFIKGRKPADHALK